MRFAAKGLVHRYAGTRGVGAVAGRTVPYVGWALVGWDIGWYLGQNYGISTWFDNSNESKITDEILQEYIHK